VKPEAIEHQLPAVVFAGGGTGGHLFPGVAIAEVLRARRPLRPIVFACSEREIDARILEKQTLAGEPVVFRTNPGKPFGLRPATLLRFVRAWGGAVRQGRGLIRELRAAAGGERPIVVAMGGFVAAPLVQAARAERCRILMMNLDAVPGRANRWISRHADRILTTANVPDCDWTRIKPLVRSQARWGGTRGEARQRLGLDPSRPTLFITGASQGSKSINRFLIELVGRSGAEFRDWQIIHQTGPTEAPEARAAYAGAGVPAVVEPFFDVMAPCWGAADCAVARAGAGSVSEAWANGVPTLFMPYPFHADQHQLANAAELVDGGAAVVAEDLVEPGRNLDGAAGLGLMALLRDVGRRDELRRGLAALGPVDGAERVADVIEMLGG